jgi:aspartyl-tRNA(Asn)/glutamyl-tRNA(Gln) amidotransferase subunit A
MTAAEGAGVHLENLRSRPADFDPATRDRLLAGALVPAAIVLRAHRLRRWFLDHVMEMFRDVDVLLAPCTPCEAPLLGQTLLRLDHREVPLRANIGIYTQPLSFAGLPVVAAPIPRAEKLPFGVQIVAAPWKESTALQVAAELERIGIAAAPPAPFAPDSRRGSET